MNFVAACVKPPGGPSDQKSAEDGPTPGQIWQVDDSTRDVSVAIPGLVRAASATTINYSGTAKAKAGDTATPPFTGSLHFLVTHQNAGGGQVGPALYHTLVDVKSTNPGQWTGTVVVPAPAGTAKVSVHFFMYVSDTSAPPKSGSSQVLTSSP